MLVHKHAHNLTCFYCDPATGIGRAGLCEWHEVLIEALEALRLKMLIEHTASPFNIYPHADVGHIIDLSSDIYR